jgi:hypothetical protein
LCGSVVAEYGVRDVVSVAEDIGNLALRQADAEHGREFQGIAEHERSLEGRGHLDQDVVFSGPPDIADLGVGYIGNAEDLSIHIPRSQDTFLADDRDEGESLARR